MESTTNTNTAQKHSFIFKGWTMCIIGALLALCGGAATSLTYSVNGYLASQGLIASTTPGICTSIVSLCSVLFATIIGNLIKKKGLKAVVFVGLVATCICQLIVMLLPINDAILIACFFMFGTCLVIVSKLGSPILVNTWFSKNKALPMAIVIAAASFATIFAGIQGGLMDSKGKTGGMLVVFVICAVGAVISLFISEDVKGAGEVKDGRAWRERKGLPMVDEATAASGAVGTADKGMILKSSKFWIFTLGCLLRMGVYGGSSGYVTLIILSRGFTAAQAATAVASLSLASTVGRLATPAITKFLRLSNINASVLAHAIAFAGCMLIFFSSSLGLFNVAVALIGFAYGLGFVSQTLALSDLFPTYNFQTLIGVFQTFVGCSFIFPTLYGVIGTSLGNFAPIYFVLGIVNIIFAVIVFFIGVGNKKNKVTPAV